MTAAFLSRIVLGLRLPSASRMFPVGAAFAAPTLDFVGLWGAHLSVASARLWAAVALAGGYAMAIVYIVTLAITIRQCWFSRKDVSNV